jgi:hypothetical protein
MIVSTSGSCSRIFSERRPSAIRRMMVGTSAATRPTAAARSTFCMIAAPSTAPSKPAPTVATTNSPERMLMPAASRRASSFSPNPCAFAKRAPNDDMLSGIHPVPA